MPCYVRQYMSDIMWPTHAHETLLPRLASAVAVPDAGVNGTYVARA